MAVGAPAQRAPTIIASYIILSSQLGQADNWQLQHTAQWARSQLSSSAFCSAVPESVKSMAEIRGHAIGESTKNEELEVRTYFRRSDANRARYVGFGVR